MEYLDDVDVHLVDHMGSDAGIIAAARVSTQGAESLTDLDQPATKGLLNYLMKNRHGTPFEHGAMTFFVKAPIFVFREFHRHRIGFSYNEESARYKPLEPHFYVPRSERPGLMQQEGGKPGQYQYKDANLGQWVHLTQELEAAYQYAYDTYKNLLRLGYAKEVARMVLPVGIFSSMYVTCNPRSIMSFLSLRQKHEEWNGTDGAKFPSKPQHEINMVADLMEEVFARHFPITWVCYTENGRVAP